MLVAKAGFENVDVNSTGTQVEVAHLKDAPFCSSVSGDADLLRLLRKTGLRKTKQHQQANRKEADRHAETWIALHERLHSKFEQIKATSRGIIRSLSTQVNGNRWINTDQWVDKY
ncbi:hypothetical protein [Lignipirellula cremea]|uniref:hypothetical protein n=1 Tax=Lignipirellula cremea TaxID=2528010 RepID=UPI001E5C2F83|nr:hypothetical protein [Lignipirellula cremea]